MKNYMEALKRQYKKDYTPTYNYDDYNNNCFMEYTNCYSYAFGLQINPLTGQRFPVGGNQPGLLSGDSYYLNTVKYQKNTPEHDAAVREYVDRYMLGTVETNKNLVNVVKRDASAVGLNFVEYKDGMTGGKRVAFVLKPSYDYQWYVYDEEKGVWGNKNGRKKATNKPLERDRENYGEDDITDYTKAAELLGYTTMLGEYYITRKKIVSNDL